MSARLSKDEAAPAPGYPMPGALPFNKLPFEAFSRASEALKDACADYQRELTEFAMARLKANIELQEAVVASRDVANIARLQQRWAMTAFQDYMQEGEKLARLGASTLRSSMDSWLRVADTRASSVPLPAAPRPPAAKAA